MAVTEHSGQEERSGQEQRTGGGLLLAGRSAVVTGGSRGIGAAIARSLAGAGCQVAVWARDPAPSGSPAQEGLASAVSCDVTSRESVAGALEQTISRHGFVDVLVAAAGRGDADRRFPDVADSDWDDVIRTNLTGVYNVVKPVSQHMIDRGQGGKIIVISSIAAGFAMPRAVAYAAAKAGLSGFTRSVAVALARQDIQVNSVNPGWIETDMNVDLYAREDQATRLVRRTPAHRLGQPDDIVGICLYLASAASGFHTGDVISVDGGFSIA